MRIRYEQQARTSGGALESHNVVIRLKEPETLSGLYGLKKNYQILLLHADEKHELVEAVSDAMLGS